MKVIKKMIRFTIFIFILILTICFGLYGYQKVSTKLEIKSANNIALYDIDGNMYFQGEGTEINDKEAIKYLLKAIDVDSVNTMKAEYILGMIYYAGKENGIEVEENKEYGLELIKRAAEKGYEDAVNKLKELNIN